MVVLPPNPRSPATAADSARDGRAASGGTAIDVVFPVMHGPLCEDGTIQGLLELADVPYVGCGVLASAVGMDKDVAKRLARDAGIPRRALYRGEERSLGEEPRRHRRADRTRAGLSGFVKPANMGSSVGVHKVKDADEARRRPSKTPSATTPKS